MHYDFHANVNMLEVIANYRYWESQPVRLL